MWCTLGQTGRLPIPRHPAARINKSLQAEATTCRSPGSLDCPGFFFVTVKAFSLGSQILPESVSRRPHCSFIRVAAAVDGTDDIATD